MKNIRRLLYYGRVIVAVLFLGYAVLLAAHGNLSLLMAIVAFVFGRGYQKGKYRIDIRHAREAAWDAAWDALREAATSPEEKQEVEEIRDSVRLAAYHRRHGGPFPGQTEDVYQAMLAKDEAVLQRHKDSGLARRIEQYATPAVQALAGTWIAEGQR